MFLLENNKNTDQVKKMQCAGVFRKGGLCIGVSQFYHVCETHKHSLMKYKHILALEDTEVNTAYARLSDSMSHNEMLVTGWKQSVLLRSFICSHIFPLTPRKATLSF